MSSKASHKTQDKTNAIASKNIFTRTMIIALIIVVFIIINVILLRAQYLNAMQVGEQYTSIVNSNMQTQYGIGFICAVIAFLIIYINNKVSKRGIKKFFDEDKVPMPKLPNKSIAVIVAILVFIILPGFVVKDFTMFVNGTQFGGNLDPIFNSDTGFYLFKLPFLELMVKLVIISNIGLIIYNFIYYVVILNTNLNGVSVDSLKKNTLISQTLFYVMMAVIFSAIAIILYTRQILTQDMVNPGMDLTGAGSTDVMIKLWGYRILSIVIIISVIGIFIAIKRQSFKQGFICAMFVPIYLFGMFIVMVYYQNIVVSQNQLDKEKTFIEYNIDNTKFAYGINIEQTGIENYDTITQNQIEENKSLLENIPTISSDVILKMVGNGQDNGTYYSYKETNLARYNFTGENQLVYITPREVLSGFDMSRNNRTYKYTHGYSAVINTASDNTGDGYSEYILNNYQNNAGNIIITEPRIYFGLHTNSIIAVNTNYGKEYDYPITATTYEENEYNGTAGIKYNFWDRFVLGLTNGQADVAFSSYLNENSKIISNRNILDRVKSILPYIEYDNNPYLVIDSMGRLIWVIDGYTTSNKYPYSQITEVVDMQGHEAKINYIRNSVKVLIDAYNGTTTFYITDKNDPAIMVYKNMYPKLFSDQDIPIDISSHFTYPKYLYDVQSRLIATYHDVSSDILYRADDLWQISTTLAATKNSTTIEPTYTTLRLPNGKEEFGLVLTYSKKGKQSIIAYLVGIVSNGAPKLNLYKYSSDSNIVGISQLNAQIEQDETITKELEKLNVTGTKLTKDIKIIPIENTLLYVESVYQVMLNDQESTPQLKKIIVASGNKIAIGDTLTKALNGLFTDYVDVKITDPNDIGTIIDSLLKSNANLKESMESGSFEMMGKDLETLQEWINKLQTARNKEIKEQKDNKDNTNTNSTNTSVVQNLVNNIVFE